MEQGCFVKIYVPSDLSMQITSIRAKGMFAPSAGGDGTLSSADYECEPQEACQATYQHDRADDPSPSIRVNGCNQVSSVGRSPSGSLMIDSISTPLAMKDSGLFTVSVYKDEELKMKIAEIVTGVYIPAQNLSPGSITEIKMTPLDSNVQKTTTHTITFVNEHILDATGRIVITLPTTLVLPEVGSTMEVKPLAGSISATSAEVIEGNKLRIDGIFAGMREIPKEAHEFQFQVVGI